MRDERHVAVEEIGVAADRQRSRKEKVIPWPGCQPRAEAPARSPDGTTVAFIGTEGGIYRRNGVLYVVDVATGDVTETLLGAATGRRHENRPNWLPDGEALLVMTEAP